MTATNRSGTGPASGPSNAVTPSSLVTVTSVTPHGLAQGATRSLTITRDRIRHRRDGIGLGDRVTLRGVNVLSSTTIEVTGSVAADAATGSRDVTVTDRLDSGTCTACLTVSPGPVLTSATPPHVAVAAKGTVSFLGSGFGAGATLSITGPSNTVKTSNVTITSTTVTATVSVPSGTHTGAYTVTITNIHGSKATCTTCFAVIAAPTLQTLTPSSVVQGSSTPVTLKGTGFATGAKVTGPSGVTFSGMDVINSQTIRGTMTVSSTAPRGTKLSVTVTNNPAGGYGKVTSGVLSIT